MCTSQHLPETRVTVGMPAILLCVAPNDTCRASVGMVLWYWMFRTTYWYRRRASEKADEN